MPTVWREYTVYLNDPDTQSPRWAGWVAGGQITLAYVTFRAAAFNAAPGPYGIIVSDSLTSAPPATPGGLAAVGSTAGAMPTTAGISSR